MAKIPTRVSLVDASTHRCVSQFGWQLLLMKRAMDPLNLASMT